MRLGLKQLIAAAGALAAAGAAFAQSPVAPTEVTIDKLALTNIPAITNAKLTVRSPAFKNMNDIPFENTQFRADTFPGLIWSRGPAGTKSYSVIMQDTDVKLADGSEILHWTMYNIPAKVTSLPAGMTDPVAGSAYGPNIRAAVSAYLGPKPRAGPAHRYHFQVFALDTTIVDAPANYAALAAAMKGHVVASGQIIGLGVLDPTYTPPPAPAAK